MVSTAHEQLVHSFFREQQSRNPKRFEEVCKRNPVLSGRQWQRVREKETRLTAALSEEMGIESGYDEE